MGVLGPPGEREIYKCELGKTRHKFAKVWFDRYSLKSAACVRMWREVYCSRARTSVSLQHIYSILKVVHSLPLQASWCWLMRRLVDECRSRVAEIFWLVTDQRGFGPWTLDGPLFTAPLPAQQVTMCDCHAPQSTSNKKLGPLGKELASHYLKENRQGVFVT